MFGNNRKLGSGWGVGAGVALALLTWTGAAVAQQPELDKFVASDGEAWDRYGHAVAMEGSVAVVGSPWDDDLGTDSGAVYILQHDGTQWSEQIKLTASDGAAGDLFGECVAISGERIVVGAHLHDSAAADGGAAYVFRYKDGSWNEDIKLTASDAFSSDWFGHAVAIDGNLIAIGAPGVNVTSGDEGAVYVFRRGAFGWLEEKRVTASDAYGSDLFGLSVAVSGDVILAGAQYATYYDGGTIYFYRDNGGSWDEEARFLRPDDGYWFGAALALEGNLAVVGFPHDNDKGGDSGSACVFEYDGASWSMTQKLIGDDTTSWDNFGHSVATDGTTIAVGSPYHDHPVTDAGTVYTFLYAEKTWAQDAELGATDSAAYDDAGFAVAMEGNRALVNARLDDDLGAECGSLYEFSVREFTTTATPGSVQAGDRLTFQISYGEPGGTVMLVATDVGGVPIFYTVILYIFATDHKFTLPITVPQGLAGYDIGFSGLKVNGHGRIAWSTRAEVQFN